ncbi:MAG TPA: phosphate regulon transcriptional regulatory protein PhoB [Sedimenticola sp.]|nr:phosphate regulon transcriptional regulatory protein PhoB [Sedimenticola sp.]
MSAPTILVVEDEAAVREMLRFTLRQKGLDVVEAEDAASAERHIRKRRPSLILLDWMLPGKSGVELARQLKRDPATRDIPILMLTARGQEDDKVLALESGADDYVTKPFSTRELQARIRAILRRVAPPDSDQEIEMDGLSLDPATHRVFAGGEKLELGPTEFRLLHYFMAHPERVYSRAQLLDRVWGTNVFIEERTVDVHIRRLRKALEPSGHDGLLQTVRGAGYRFSTKG